MRSLFVFLMIIGLSGCASVHHVDLDSEVSIDDETDVYLINGEVVTFNRVEFKVGMLSADAEGRKESYRSDEFNSFSHVSHVEGGKKGFMKGVIAGAGIGVLDIFVFSASTFSGVVSSVIGVPIVIGFYALLGGVIGSISVFIFGDTHTYVVDSGEDGNAK